MTHAAPWMKFVLFALLTLGVTGGISSPAHSADLPLAAASPLSGVAFDDRPLLLPVQRNFQMAMLTAGSELGRSCGKMEAYGWRMSQTEQGRVNQIFNNTVDRLRLMGYTIAPQTLNSVSKDITLFTADNANKHFIFLWSAGELGLVMTLCETSAPLPSSARAAATMAPVQVFPVPMDVVSSHLDAPGKSVTKASSENFSPVGEWVGSYICEQGYTGGTLEIDHLNGRDFEGEFHFYPTDRNPTVPPGAYTVYGQYDAETKRILINPGKWIKRPANFYNTVIVGGFDPIKNTFSSYFQGVSGCTSFEAKREGAPSTEHAAAKTHKKIKHVVKKKKPVAKPVTPAPTASDSTTPTSVVPPPATQIVPAPVVVAPAAAPTPALQPSPAATVAPPAAAPVQVPSLSPPTPAPTVPPAPAPVAPAAGTSSVPVPAGGGILLTAPSAGK